MWQGRYQPDALRSLLRSDAHAPNRERAWTVRNLDVWYRAFKVTDREAMYLTPAERVTFW
jgi:putative endopeptidase